MSVRATNLRVWLILLRNNVGKQPIRGRELIEEIRAKKKNRSTSNSSCGQINKLQSETAVSVKLVQFGLFYFI